jgi:PAS domain S-box-containing protein
MKRIQELRSQAERWMSGHTYPVNEGSGNLEVQRLIQELHVHQEELEMQNEELIHSRLEIERSRNEYATLYDFAPVSYFTLDENGFIVQLNLMASQVLGYSRDKLLHQKFISFVVPRYGSDYHDFLKAIFEGETRQSCEIQVFNKEGKHFFVHLEGRIRDVEGLPLPACLIAMIDITERKLADETRATASHLQLVLETLPNLAWISRPDGSIYFYNYNWFDYTGASLDQLLDWGWRRFIHPSDLTVFMQLWKESIQTGKKMETSYRIKRGSDGEYRWHLVRAVPVRNHLNEILCWSGTCTDIHDQKTTEEALEKRVLERTLEVLRTNEQLKTEITQRIQVEEELRESQYFVSQIAETMPDMLHVYDLQAHQSVYINRAVTQFFGYTLQEMKQLGNSLMTKLIHPDDLPVSQKKLQALAQSSSDKPVESEYRVKDRENNWRWLRTKYAVFKRDDTGKPVQLIGITSDITEKIQAEQEIREKQYFIQQVADASPNVVYVFDLKERKSVYSNREVTDLLGYSAEKIKSIGPDILQTIMHPDDHKQAQKWFDRFNTVPDGKVLELEYRVKNAAGEWRWMYARETVFKRYDNGMPLQVLGVAQDVTVKKEAEEKLRQSEAALKKMNEELEARVTERTRRLEETLSSLKQNISSVEKCRMSCNSARNAFNWHWKNHRLFSLPRIRSSEIHGSIILSAIVMSII